MVVLCSSRNCWFVALDFWKFGAFLGSNERFGSGVVCGVCGVVLAPTIESSELFFLVLGVFLGCLGIFLVGCFFAFGVW